MGIRIFFYINVSKMSSILGVFAVHCIPLLCSSMLSSGQNALATTFVMDILQPTYQHFHEGKLPSEKFSANAAKIMSKYTALQKVLVHALLLSLD